MNNGVKWRRFKVPKQVEQINDHLFKDTYTLSLWPVTIILIIRLLAILFVKRA